MEKLWAHDRSVRSGPRPRFGVKRAAETASPAAQPAIRQPRHLADSRELDAVIVRYVHEIRSCERAIVEADSAFDGPFKWRVVIALRSALDQHRKALANLQARS